MKRADLVVVGAGLGGGLLAWRLAELRPELSLLLLESGPHAGGNHTWSFHQSDLTPEEHSWIAPFITHSWPGYEVRFPTRRRRMETGYASVPSERFAALLAERLGDRLRCGVQAVSVEPDAVVLEGGARIAAGAVVDARGPRAMPRLDLGWQKFLGQELAFERPHGLADPIVMDATVPQRDGYRFVYCLPFAPDRMLIEETFYSDTAHIDPALSCGAIEDYTRRAGWGGSSIVREEAGALPIALGGDIGGHIADFAGRPIIGFAAGLFHPTTGYSLPDAVRTADLVAKLADLSAPALAAALGVHVRETWRARRFFRALNRMLFRACPPAERRRVLEHFHRLPEPVISRFYAARLTAIDKVRILSGRPPVPVGRALVSLIGERS